MFSALLRSLLIMQLPLMCGISTLLCGGLGGCGASNDEQTLKMTLGSVTYNLEMARTEKEQQHGLMERDSMPEDHGMLFIFPASEERSFWMKNTRFDLDIIYVGEDGKIVSIKTMKAYDHAPVYSDGPAMYAIELNAGQAAKTGLNRGDRLPLGGMKAPMPATKKW